jgi:hypothetical protein
MRSLDQQVSGRGQTQERMASDSDGFPKNPNAVEQARHKAAIEISTEITALLPVQRSFAQLSSCWTWFRYTWEEFNDKAVKKVPEFYCYANDRLLHGQIWMVQFYLSLGIKHIDELYRFFLWMTNRYGTVQGTTSGSLFKVWQVYRWRQSTSWIPSLWRSLLTEQSMNLGQLEASEHSSLWLVLQRSHGDSAGIWNSVAVTGRLFLRLGQLWPPIDSTDALQ